MLPTVQISSRAAHGMLSAPAACLRSASCRRTRPRLHTVPHGCCARMRRCSRRLPPSPEDGLKRLTELLGEYRTGTDGEYGTGKSATDTSGAAYSGAAQAGIGSAEYPETDRPRHTTGDSIRNTYDSIKSTDPADSIEKYSGSRTHPQHRQHHCSRPAARTAAAPQVALVLSGLLRPPRNIRGPRQRQHRGAREALPRRRYARGAESARRGARDKSCAAG